MKIRNVSIILLVVSSIFINVLDAHTEESIKIEQFKELAEQGNADAQYALGLCYGVGAGVEKDAVESVKWVRKAAEQGNANAQFVLGCCYEIGEGVEKDAVEAVKWYSKAAEQGNANAKEKLTKVGEAAEERNIAEAKVEEQRNQAACDRYWNGFASGINERKTYKDREKYLQMVKSLLLHDNNDGTVLLNEFASEYLPNTYSKYEKAREKSLEIGQNLKSVFTKELDSNSPRWSSYLMATEKYSQILWDEKRIQNGISYIYLLHKVGACSDELLAALDKSEKMNFTFENDFKHDLNQYQAKKVDGVMEFAQKNMPETFALLETFEKEINETKVQFDRVYAEAEKLNYFPLNTTHSVFVAFEFKYKKTIGKYNAIMPQVKDLQVKHLLLEVTGEDLASQDSKIANEHKAFKDSLPEFVKTNALKGEAFYVEEIIETMVKIPGKDYLMGKYEVTQAQWQAIMGNNPSYFKGDLSRPVEYVSWNDCQEFIKKLNACSEVKSAGITFRLPTEEEWEYAGRAGSTGKYGLLADGREGTLNEMDWYRDNSGHKTHPVGQKKPNAWGYTICMVM